jgi:hypothetical protein
LKRIFEGCFPPQISSKVLKETEHRKRERKGIEKIEREKERKRKAPRVFSNKKGKSIF